jgi:hypothetical protein
MVYDTSEPEWDDEFAQAMVGATILIGLTILRQNGDLDRHVQMHGVISAAESDVGITVALAGEHQGENYTLPPDLRGFEPAAPGSYRLRSTGEVIEDPDYTTSWTITQPD